MWNSHTNAYSNRHITAYIHVYLYAYSINYVSDRDEHTHKPNPRYSYLDTGDNRHPTTNYIHLHLYTYCHKPNRDHNPTVH